MDGIGVDHWTAALAGLPTRRSALRLLSTLGLAGLLGHASVAAKHHKHKHKKHKGKGKGKGGGQVTCPAACTVTSCGSFPTNCPLLPADNIWHARVDALPPDGNSAAYIS